MKCKSGPVLGEADSLNDNRTNEDRHKGTEGQSGKVFLPCAFVPLQLCACIVIQKTK